MGQLRSREVKCPGSHIRDWQSWYLNPGCPAPQPPLLHMALGGSVVPPAPRTDTPQIEDVHPLCHTTHSPPPPIGCSCPQPCTSEGVAGDPVPDSLPGIPQFLYPSPRPPLLGCSGNHLVPSPGEVSELGLIGLTGTKENRSQGPEPAAALVLSRGGAVMKQLGLQFAVCEMGKR